MKSDFVIYYGSRDLGSEANLGGVEVTVYGGAPNGSLITLSPMQSLSVAWFAPAFDWGETNAGTRQLALAILLDFLGPPDTARAWRLHELFARRIMSTLDRNVFRLNGCWLRGFIESLESDLAKVAKGIEPELPRPS